ncbi:DUF6233 domain-containing protein [Streptomyces arenae]|uniref:DUF6233 domain-containing protein n=1 Tax=Streptomyces arenae TaxID=29301 RepID=UPI002657F67B|nr:DUF6233 domain-containing protein [Streptomyces arenae]MCG7203985.1 DUF6233 domain-containing protein [Streptomyces arenae]
MSELPPDPARLRVILAHLDKQLADHETIGTYLRLQHAAVQAALDQAEQPPPRRRSARPVKGGRSLPALAQARPETGYIVQQRRTARGPEPAVIHVDDCTMIEGAPHPITPHDARAALTDPNVTGCDFCRPDTELGIDVAG